ncbi:glyoxalase [Nocardia puris]|uniref:Glyoxalase n=1 Tax=Nocardia puris TaxID=208602 RepID=A0A366DVY1_9NOCA|nr:glyoxalase [Nocardia puris]MBF6210003.1 glyoxalase [Nocardia puris]MBF6368194.1 glyoxalase [Nocardia puris]MBF6458087.1 glyoxalase [Nocardia puris]RBO94251.1 hypothetical protein DFR74_102674 [Nocardia puris]
MDDTTVPVLWSASPATTLDFYRTLGYTVTHEQTRPYTYLVVERDGTALHFSDSPKGLPVPFESVACLVMVDDVAARHADFTARLRAAFGKVPAKGCPRLTRFRPGQSRFSLVDPDGNTMLFIQRDEPEKPRYTARDLVDLASTLEFARVLRDFKNDDRAAARLVQSGLRRHGATAPVADRARALAMLAEIAVAAGDPELAEKHRAEISALGLSDADRAAVAAELRAGADLERWLTENS